MSIANSDDRDSDVSIVYIVTLSNPYGNVEISTKVPQVHKKAISKQTVDVDALRYLLCNTTCMLHSRGVGMLKMLVGISKWMGWAKPDLG